MGGVTINEQYLSFLEKHINDIIYDKTQNTLADWIADYGGTSTKDFKVEFGSHLALQMMLERRDKEIIRIVLNSLIVGRDDNGGD